MMGYYHLIQTTIRDHDKIEPLFRVYGVYLRQVLFTTGVTAREKIECLLALRT